MNGPRRVRPSISNIPIGTLPTVERSEFPDVPPDFAAACARHIAAHGLLKSFIKYQHPPDLHWDDEHYQGDAYGAYAWAVYVAEVSVDTRTAEVRVEGVVLLDDHDEVLDGHPAVARRRRGSL